MDKLVAALLALVRASAAFVVAVVAEVDAEVALVAAAVWLVVADAASTISVYFALFALVVSGCDPELVCASLTMNMLLVLVSFTRSRTAYAVLAAKSPRNC